MNARDQAIDRITVVATGLRGLLDQFLFVGGAVTGLLITDPAAPDVRPTKDVDITIQIVSLPAFYQLEEKRRKLDFRHHIESPGHMCRWTIHGTVVDIVPSDVPVLGFNTAWYSDAIVHSINYQIDNNFVIRLISTTYFIATKIEAWKDRANGDYWHSDLEDIIAVIDGRAELISEFSSSPADVRAYIAAWFIEFLADDAATEAIEGHVGSQQSGRERVDIVMERIHEMIVAA